MPRITEHVTLPNPASFPGFGGLPMNPPGMLGANPLIPQGFPMGLYGFGGEAFGNL